jgi:hypothetical protein
MEKTNLVANIIQTFIKVKYEKDIYLNDIASNIKVFDNGKFYFNCHDFIEKNGLKLDQFKKDFNELITIYSYFTNKKEES